ncbi:MAG: YncE family protein [Planctomycetes bacterium]|nr:YncE family protein [Planctomycetota bacterium]
MKLSWLLSGCALLAASAATTSWLTAAAPTSPAPSKNRSLAISPATSSELWVVNKENDVVVVTDRTAGTVLATVTVGVSPRNIAFNTSGTKAYVTNQRGTVAIDKTVLEYTGSEILGSVSVIDTASRSVIKTITTGIGVEPYGIALAPNGKYLLVTNARSNSLSVIDPSTDNVVATMAYAADLSIIPGSLTAADIDTNNDFIPDFDAPRGVAIASTSNRAYVAHLKSGFISVVSLTLNGSGVPTALSVAKRIDLNKYPYDAFVNPTKITVAKAQGNTRFTDDLAISPDGTQLWTAHQLLNVNHDVDTPFSPGAFANRIYGAVSIVDLTTETFQWSDNVKTDNSNRLNFDWNVATGTTMNVNYGMTTGQVSRRLATLRGTAAPTLGNTNYTLKIEHATSNAPFQIINGRTENYIAAGNGGIILLNSNGVVASGNTDANGNATVTLTLPSNPSWVGSSLYYQAIVQGGPITYTNGVRAIIGNPSGVIPNGSMPVRLALPSRVEFSPDGKKALVLSRASEDVAVFDATQSTPAWIGITPRRDSTPSPTQLDKNHTQFDPNRLVGDRPTGMLIADYDVRNDIANLYTNNEISRDVARNVVSFTTGVVGSTLPTVKIVQPGNDKFNTSELTGSELFADGSRDQTTGNFAASCESCHYEGGEDGNVWQRPAGPRSTIPVYGGIRRTGMLLWKAVRMNLGETGPMFGGENGGTGVFTDAEQEGLIAYHEKISVPLNPNLENAQFSADAKVGRDLYFGINDTGMNPLNRNSNCASCHPTTLLSNNVWFTQDQIKILDPNYDQAHQDPCFSLKFNIMGNALQDVNSGVNLVDDQNVIINDRNGDNISDIESYNPANADLSGDFTRDDMNSTLCDDPNNPGNPLVFERAAGRFDIPTKIGVFATMPYFHDHAVSSLRAVIDPGSQSFPTLNKMLNTQHDLRGTQVQQFLSSTNVNDDIELILRFIRSL